MSLSALHHLIAAADEAIRRVLKEEGHRKMQRRETLLGPEITCLDCGLKVSVEDVAEEARGPGRWATLKAIGRCTRDLYRPIPGTPWFEYGAPKP